MPDEMKELEMRIAGIAGGVVPERLAEAVRAADPDGSVRIDPATGIVHVATHLDTLEIVAALSEAGFEVSAETM